MNNDEINGRRCIKIQDAHFFNIHKLDIYTNPKLFISTSKSIRDFLKLSIPNGERNAHLTPRYLTPGYLTSYIKFIDHKATKKQQPICVPQTLAELLRGVHEMHRSIIKKRRRDFDQSFYFQQVNSIKNSPMTQLITCTAYHIKFLIFLLYNKINKLS